ncbi:hypothetical protein Salat_1434800 [Sesamum alatum]|uniref:Reverse transcriptase zinc-binding domain-containing protein n=1 Tax=Sesamum alatum TaxID=300844 RepID=A0AAE1YBA6_9LAMI|nr:hypothetical protein Salat_1434800 [Sesamum alatum]
MEVGASPSFTRRSLLATEEVLVSGTRWKVGDGKSNLIVRYPWPPRPVSFQVVFPLVELERKAKVASLISADGYWNEALIRATFDHGDADSILFIELQDSTKAVDIVWLFEKKGSLTVRIAYEVANSTVSLVGSSNSSPSWNFVWQSHVPPKVRLFVWHYYKDALPTLSPLACRREFFVSPGRGRDVRTYPIALHFY